jgi:UDP-glucose 4-epimerase
MAHILVTGGGGFIGSHSVDHLLALGHRVRVLDDFSSGHRHNLASHAQLEVVQGDIRDLPTVEACLQGVERVLHLAAQVFVPASIERPLHSASINLTGFLHVLDASRRLGVQRLVYASSAAVYGTPTQLPLTEASPTQALSPYGLEKLVNDQYAALFGQLYGLSCCGLRYFNVYGPRQDPRSAYSGVISKFCERAMAGEPLVVFGDGLQTRDFVAVADVARANAAALFSDAGGVINVATGHSVTLLQLIEALAAVWGAPLPVEHRAGRSGEVRDSAVQPLRLRDDLGLRDPAGLHAGLQRLVNHLRG